MPEFGQAYAGALEKLAADPELRKKLGEAGRARVLEKFTYDTFRTNILELMEKL